MWFLNVLLHYKEPELLREIADSITGLGRVQLFFLPENTKRLKELQGQKTQGTA